MNDSLSKSLTYADAGVDIEKADNLVANIKKIAKKTPQSGVMGSIGGFGGLFAPNLSNIEKPVLVSSTDGVGTKLKVAFMMDKHDTIGIDLVGMCVNDIAVQGAKPLFFLDYISMGTLNNDTASAIVEGIAEGCRQAGCALIGGETAEMPGIYQENEYDLAGFSVGLVDDSKIIDGSEIRVGHKLVGIASNGLHSNGYSLVRKICFDVMGLDIHTHVPELDKTIGEELIVPTKIYSEVIQGIIKNMPVHGLAHITGGGISENIIRIIPDRCKVRMYKDSWEIPPIFQYLQMSGNVTDIEMMKTFNNGIGLIAVVPDGEANALLNRLKAMDEKAFLVGEIIARKDDESQIEWV